MKKKLISLVIFMLLMNIPNIVQAEFISSPEPYDYKNGLLDDEGLIKRNDFPLKAYDNDLSVYQTSELESYVIEFNYPVHLKQMFFSYRFLNATFYFIGGETDTMSFKNYSSVTTEYIDLDFNNVTKIEMKRNTEGSDFVREIDFFGSYEKIKVYDKPHSITAETTHNSISLNWINPHLIGFKNVALYVDGKLKETIPQNITSYTLTNLKPNQSYQIELSANYDDEGKSPPEIISVLTDPIEPEKKEISGLRAKATHEKVNLSWNLPIIQDDFNHVNIYRGQEKEEIAKRTLFTNVASAEEPLQKIFETNGTYFNDLTVEPDTTYNYKLTVSEINGIETSGISTRVTTAPEPPPEIENLIITKPTDDGYLLTWETPTENDMEIIVGGNLYDKVPASDKEYFIPFEDVPLDMFGNPQIELIATKPDGQKSKPTTPTPDSNIDNIKLPFTIQEVLTTIMEIIRILAPIILLALAIKLTPKLINLIRKVAENKKRG